MGTVLRTAAVALEAASEVVEALGPLKAIFRVISGVYTHYKVGSLLIPQPPPPDKLPTGNYYCHKHNQ